MKSCWSYSLVDNGIEKRKPVYGSGDAMKDVVGARLLSLGLMRCVL